MDEIYSKLFDAKRYKPKKGQVMVRYQAMADLIEGDLKTDVINLLQNNDQGANASIRMLQNNCYMNEKDAIMISKEISEDLLNGMSLQEVSSKPYRFKLEILYYTDKDTANQLSGNVHWTKIDLIDRTQLAKNMSIIDSVLPEEVKTEL